MFRVIKKIIFDINDIRKTLTNQCTIHKVRSSGGETDSFELHYKFKILQLWQVIKDQ